MRDPKPAYTVPVVLPDLFEEGFGTNADDEDFFTVAAFREACEEGLLISYDGSGRPVREGFADMTTTISPSRLEDIPDDATHILWFGR